MSRATDAETHETLWSDGLSTLVRRRRAGHASLLFGPTAGEPSTAALTRLDTAYALRTELDASWAAVPRERRQRPGPSLVLDDPGGRLLVRVLEERLPLATCLALSLSIARGIAAMHARGIVHKDLKPSNLLVDPATGRAWLTGFGLASRISRERTAAHPADDFAGSLSYMAPEQTGRMNRAVDSRADLYSFGIVLYEMLCGRLPFVALTPVEWVHCHVARLPAPMPASVPEGLAAIVDKLLAKSADERYQTASGLHADLSLAHESLSRTGTIPCFALAERDVTNRPFIPGSAYGRGEMLSLLLSAHERVARSGRPELLLVTGRSGIGKSALVDELHKSVLGLQGSFCAGKYDQFKRNVPYATLSSALADLARQILRHSDLELARWRALLRDAVGAYGALATRIVPQLELLLGPQPALPSLTPPEERQRVLSVLSALLRACASAGGALTLFLDDLHWSDPATLELLRYFFEQSQEARVLVIGAYRDNEVAAGSALARTLETIRELGPFVHEVPLGPLATEHYAELLRDMLRGERQDVFALAALVHEKTGGNPFFAIHFISTLVEDGLLAFDAVARCWRWDLSQIRARALTDNVVDLLIGKLERLPRGLQEALVVLACLGRAGTVETLSQLLERGAQELDALLAPASVLGMIVRTDDGYQFAHDRVQEAAHQLASSERRAALHLTIARRLYGQRAEPPRAEDVFAVAGHYNDAAALVHDETERRLAAELNLAAAVRARAGGAFSAAAAYAEQARRHLGEGAWHAAPELTTQVELMHAQCDHLDGNLEPAAARLELLASQAQEPVALAEIARTRGEVLFARGQVPQAIAACVEFLRKVGVQWPESPTLADVRSEYDALLTRLEGRPIRSLTSLPKMTDPLLRAYSNVLLAMVSPAGVTADRSTFGMTLLRMINLGIEHGLMPAATLAFARGAEVLAVMFDDWERALDCEAVARVLVERDDFATHRGRVLTTIGVTIQAWTAPFRDGRTLLARGRRLTLEEGDVTYHAIASINGFQYGLAMGEPLDALLSEGRAALAAIAKSRFMMMEMSMLADVRFVQKLAGEPVTEALPAALAHPGNRLGTLSILARDVLAAVYMGQDAEALALLPSAEPLSLIAPIRMHTHDLHFAAVLAHAAAGEAEAARSYAQKYLSWAQRGAGFRSRCRLVEAELLARDGRFEEAGRRFDDTVSLARSDDAPNIEALASQRAAGFYERRRLYVPARAYRAQALRAWRRWGAHGRLRTLDCDPLQTKAPGASLRGIGVSRVAALAQTVAAEIELESLAERVLTLALTEGEAERGEIFVREATTLRCLARADGGVVQSVHEPIQVAEPLLLRACDTLALASDDARLVLALPLVNQGRLVGALRLERERSFSSAHASVLTTLASLAAIALEHARLFAELRVAEGHRTEAERLSRTGSFSWKLATGQSSWSEEALAIYGYTGLTPQSSLLLLERVHPEDRSRVAHEMEHVTREGCDWASDFRLLLPSGAVRHVHIEARSVGAAEQAAELAGAIVDVSAAKLLEQSLQASRRELAVILASIEDGVVVVDESDHVTFMNRAAEHMTGWSHEAALGQSYTTVVAKQDGMLLAKSHLLVPIDERRAPLRDELGVVRGAVSVVRDASEQVEAERAEGLSLVNERIQLALRGSSVGIWEIALDDGQLPPGHPVRSVNIWESLGWDSEHVPPDRLDASHPERVHPGDLAQLWHAYRRHLRGELSSVIAEARFLHRDGQYRWLLILGRLVHDAAGRPIRLAGTAIDITERRALETEVHQAHQAAEAANHAKDEFLANVSHEVRTPMNAILGMTELALSTELSEEQRHWLTTVKSAADNLLVIIDELLDYSKAEANKLELAREPFEIRELLADTLRVLAVRAHRKSLELVGDVAREVPRKVVGDRNRIRQVLVNLIGNAIKFTAEGDVSATVSLGPELGPDRVELVIRVRDTGIGIAIDKQAVVFEAFAQEDTSTTRRFGGTGLGLTIAARLAAMMQGRIDLESVTGQGSTFTVHLQLELAHGFEREVLPRLEPGSRVLVVEQNRLQRETLTRWCRELGAAALSAESGVEAIHTLRVARAARERIHAILLDTKIALDRELLDGARMITLGRAGDPRDRADASEADAHLQKPLTQEELSAVLGRLLDPALVDQGQPMSAAAQVRPDRAARCLHVLVGEDNEHNADLVRELLSRRGHDVTIVSDGEAVLAHSTSGSYDLLLLDVHMPRLDGFEVTRALRERERRTGARLPIVALTARSRREDRERCLAVGMDEFLSKPLQSKLLFETIERLTHR